MGLHGVVQLGHAPALELRRAVVDGGDIGIDRNVHAGLAVGGFDVQHALDQVERPVAVPARVVAGAKWLRVDGSTDCHLQLETAKVRGSPADGEAALAAAARSQGYRSGASLLLIVPADPDCHGGRGVRAAPEAHAALDVDMI